MSEPSYENILPPKGKRGQPRKAYSLPAPLEIAPIIYQDVFSAVEQEVRDNRQLPHVSKQNYAWWQSERMGEIKKVCSLFDVNFSEEELHKLGKLKHSDIAEHISAKILYVSVTTLNRFLPLIRNRLLYDWLTEGLTMQSAVTDKSK